MASNKVYLPYLNDIKLVQQNYVLSDKYHIAHFDESLFVHQIYDFQEEKKYYQKFQTNDKIYFQVISDFGVVQVRLINCEEEIIVTGTVAPILNSFYNIPKVAYGCTIDLTGVPTGYYYVKVLVGIGAGQMKLISEPIYVDVNIPNSILFQYNHRKNFYGSIFQNGETFSFRCEAILTDFKPSVNSVVFEDQTANLVSLSATAFRSFELVIGDGYGSPDWVADKINRIFCCSNALLDGKQFVRSDGSKMSRNGDKLYTMAGWTIEVREAKANNGVTFSNDLPTGSDVISILFDEPVLFGDTAGLTTDAVTLKVK